MFILFCMLSALSFKIWFVLAWSTWAWKAAADCWSANFCLASFSFWSSPEMSAFRMLSLEFVEDICWSRLFTLILASVARSEYSRYLDSYKFNNSWFDFDWLVCFLLKLLFFYFIESSNLFRLSMVCAITSFSFFTSYSMLLISDYSVLFVSSSNPLAFLNSPMYLFAR